MSWRDNFLWRLWVTLVDGVKMLMSLGLKIVGSADPVGVYGRSLIP